MGRLPFLCFFLSTIGGVLLAGTTTNEIKVGVLTALSGNNAMYREIADTIRFRFEEANRGNLGLHFKVIVEDTDFDPKRTYLAAIKLLKVDKVDVLIPISSTSQKIATPLAIKEEIPLVSLGDENSAKYPWSYNYHPTKDDSAILALQAAKSLGVRKIAIVALKDAGFLAETKAWEQQAEKEGIKVEGVFYSNPEDLKDYRAHILRMKELNADLNACFMYGVETEIFLKQARQLGLKNITAMDTLETLDDKKLAAGLWLAGEPLMSEEFKDKMKKAGIEVHLTYSPYCYDIADIIVQAVSKAAAEKKTKHPTGYQIDEALEQFSEVITPNMGKVHRRGALFLPHPVLIYYDSSGHGKEVTFEELIATVKEASQK